MLKLDWMRVKFGEVVRLNTERCADPLAEGIERYVGLEHMTPGDLRVRAWGLVAEGTTFTNLFRPGQVLFGKRRAYQRKVAVAEFAGVCSGDIYVFEPRDPKMLLPKLLPFICQTERFFEHAVGTSAGSLSPRTNWTQLAEYEFALPPLAEQQKLVTILGAFHTTQEQLHEAKVALEKVFQSALQELMSKGLNDEASTKTENLVHPCSWPVRKLESIATVERGKFSHRPRNLPEFYGGPYPFVQTGDVAASRGELVQITQTLSEEGLQYSRSFPANTILITIAAVIGATAITKEETWCTDSVVGIIAENPMNVRFLEYALRYIRPYLEFRVATQTAQKNINLQTLRPLIVPYPPFEEQARTVEILSKIETAVTNIENRLNQNRFAGLKFQNRLF